MNPQADNFEQIRKVLALKRHEQPPPGYFQNLSARIISRIESAESDQPTLWERLGFAFGSKPAFVCALGVVACGLICIGLLSTQGTAADAIARQQPFDTQSALMLAGPQETRSSIEPVISQVSAFDQIPVRPERASYTPPRQ
ncbi:MAG TPA: hypothetical protein VFC26_07975 [Verrucomicrobiae bacterium]|nr:hypothetical protein [Verrucomicrobiae bacterium]